MVADGPADPGDLDRLELRLLGRASLVRDGTVIDLSPRALGVLLRLALERGPVGREQLLIDLWGDDVGSDRMRSLETLVSSIRRVIGRDGIVLRSDAYELVAPVDVDIEHVMTTARGLAGGRTSPAALATALLVIERGRPLVHTLGVGRWVEDLERELDLAVDAVVEAQRVGDVPALQYTTSGGHHIAYQVRAGEGMPIILLAGLATHCEGIWDAPGFRTWVEAAFGPRPVVMFDKRGTGLSDPVDRIPSDEDFCEDVCAVLDAAALGPAVLVCAAEAGMFGPHVAVRRPDRIVGSVFINATPRMFESEDYPHGLPERIAREFGDSVRDTWARDEVGLRLAAPSRAFDVGFQQWAARYQRLCATPGTIWRLAQYTAIGDGRDAVEQLDGPALILQSRHSSYFRPSSATWIGNALGVEPVWLDTDDHLFWVADPAVAARAISEFLHELDPR